MAPEEKTPTKMRLSHGLHLQLPTAEQNADAKLDGFRVADG